MFHDHDHPPLPSEQQQQQKHRFHFIVCSNHDYKTKIKYIVMVTLWIGCLNVEC